MKIQKAKLIFLREVRDQLRDRRTIFMILVLPLILYPALGFGIFQLTLSFGKQQRTVGVVGFDELPGDFPLLSKDHKGFSPELLPANDPAREWSVVVDEKFTRDDVKRGRVDALIEVGVGTAERLKTGGQASLRILYDGGDDRSELAHIKVRDIIARWSDSIVESRIKNQSLSEHFAHPIKITDGVEDISARAGRSGSAWSRMFPFLIVMMALTGAFYPAIDLCAGEKERGTMETLLITPASRGEIVLGKFLAIFLFSVATTVVNLVSMGLTFIQTSSMVPAGALADLLAPPSWISIGWMFVLMLPLAAFFSAMCMSLAIFARSMKEGQYYLMPLFLIVTPLVFVTLAPGVELTPLYSLVPVTNVALLLKKLLLNEYQTAAVYFIPVLAPTILYGFMALRYAADQFNREEVLFREAERFDIRAWAVQLFRDKSVGTTFGQAWAFFIFYMLFRWYSQRWFQVTPEGIILQQVLTILLPAVLMACLLNRRPLQSLNLRPPHLVPTAVAILLAVTLHPVAITFAGALQKLLPTPLSEAEQIMESLKPLVDAPLWVQLMVIALTPAICEEIAFRGIMLTGFMQGYKPRMAIVVSAMLFGVSHMLPQQMIATSILGVILGVVTLKTGSLLPSMAFHAIHNGLVVYRMESLKHIHSEQNVEQIAAYSTDVVLMSALASALLFGTLVSLSTRIKRLPRTLVFENPPSVASVRSAT